MKRSMMTNGIVMVALLFLPALGLGNEGYGTMHHGGKMYGGDTHPSSDMMGHGMKHGMKRHHHHSFSPLALKDELKLSPDQVQALEPVERDYRKTMIRKGADIQVAFIELGELLDQKTPDVNQLKQKVDEIENLRGGLMMFRIQALLKLKEILSQAQYDTFRSMLREEIEESGHSRHGGMSGMMGGMGYGGRMGGHGRGMMEHRGHYEE